MAHTLIVGMTRSGKSTAAKQLCRLWKPRGLSTLVFDPLNDTGYVTAGAALHTGDRARFLWTVRRSLSCFVIFDEGGESIGRYDKEVQEVFTRGRHNGHMVAAVCQNATQIAPIIRDQCTNLFLFASGRRQAVLMAEEFNSDILLTATSLNRGEYYFKTKFSGVTKGRAF